MEKDKKQILGKLKLNKLSENELEKQKDYKALNIFLIS